MNTLSLTLHKTFRIKNVYIFQASCRHGWTAAMRYRAPSDNAPDDIHAADQKAHGTRKTRKHCQRGL
ncbi:hypothetical protein L543_2110 [Bordetella hinzii L60]|nr:hypothetical protein L543_2110 [Bordetella hinzii L60]